MSNDSIIELEYKIAEQELSNSKLSDELYAQQQRIDKLEQQLNAILAVLKSDSDHGNNNEVPNDPPPHY